MSPLLIAVIVIAVALALLVTLGMARAAAKGDQIGDVFNPADRWGAEERLTAEESRALFGETTITVTPMPPPDDGLTYELYVDGELMKTRLVPRSEITE